jgi:hypothetical protein
MSDYLPSGEIEAKDYQPRYRLIYSLIGVTFLVFRSEALDTSGRQWGRTSTVLGTELDSRDENPCAARDRL